MLEKPLGTRLGSAFDIQPNLTYQKPVFEVLTDPNLPAAPAGFGFFQQPSTGGSGGSFNAGTGGVS